MDNSAGAVASVVALPTGGGAQRGMGETFTPQLQTGTGNSTVPIAVPAGRNGVQPNLNLVYSTGQGNGPFGVGWTLSVPGVARKTAKGVPRYRDEAATTDEWDTFILSGSEDLVPLPEGDRRFFRPRTEGLFARVEWVRGEAGDYWEVRTKDGLRSRYGTARPQPADPAWRDSAVVADSTDRTHITAWRLTETEDTFGNRIAYDYLLDEDPLPSRRWVQSYLKQIRYVDHLAGNRTNFLVSVTFAYEPRPDVSSDRRPGFEVRTALRCRAIRIATHADQIRTVRTYELRYEQARLNGVSLLRRIDLVGADDIDRLPPLEFDYTRFEPDRRHGVIPITGPDRPPASLARPAFELADLTGDGLPDVLEMDGTVRYWRNLGGARFDRPQTMRDAPAGLALADSGVQLMDADGDGRLDLVVTRPGLAGYFPLRFDGRWDRDSFRPYRPAPTFSLEDPAVAPVDLNGDGVPDLVRAGPRLACAINDPDRGGWEELRWLPPGALEDLPSLTFTDPRVKWADLSGDGLQDLVLVHNGSVRYWPNLGYGRWDSPVTMQASPRFPWTWNPARLLLGDVDGDGLADLVYVDDGKVTLWINQSGRMWSGPVEIDGTPAVTDMDAVRLVDLLGTGIRGVLWSSDADGGLPRANMHFLDLTGTAKPYLLNEMDNHLGAVTRVEYRPSTVDYLRDREEARTRWRTPLPFPVHVVARVEALDSISRGKVTTEYRYHHGYWDGGEREFRGFGMVEQFDTEEFERYHKAGLHGAAEFAAVAAERFSPPTRAKTWFHLGPVGDEFGEWDELDYSGEFWEEDPSAFGRHPSVTALLTDLARRRDRRDALRALRGRMLRSEMYALDGSARAGRPYTVRELCDGMREESPPGPAEAVRRRIFFPYLVAERTTVWERGDDPLHRLTFVDAYGLHGQPMVQTAVALPRRTARRHSVTGAVVGTLTGDDVNETRVLATHTRTSYATPDANLVLHDRVAHVRTFELRAPPEVEEQDPDDLPRVLEDQWDAALGVHDAFTAALDPWQPGEPIPDRLRLIGHVVHHYDGAGFTGRPAGEVGPHGGLTRREALVFVRDEQDGAEDHLDAAYGERRPVYLGGGAELPDGAPVGFGANLGYRLEVASANGYRDGYYLDTLVCQRDVQAPGSAQRRGLVVATRDALGQEIALEPDAFWLLPAKITDAAGLSTTAEYDLWSFLPSKVTDANGNVSRYRYTPLGLLEKVVLGRDTEAEPGIEYAYDFAAYDRTRHDARPQPISVRTRQRVAHAMDGGSDDVIESREYSDGFGRLIQKRAQADDLAFGDDVGLLVGGEPVPGQFGGPAVGDRDGDRVVVTGWQTYDNKGRVVERYEPFLAAGWAYQPENEARRGRHATLHYDPRGQVVRTVGPDGSEQRVVRGTPPAPDDLDDPTAFLPNPWESYGYDANDLAPLGSAPDGSSLAARAPVAHHFTPASTLVDALGRPRCRIVRNGADPASDWFVTQSVYDGRGNLVAVRDALGRTALRHAYDLQNRLLRVDSMDGGVRTSVLDALGNLVEHRDAKRAVALRRYDRLSRPTELWAVDRDGEPVTLRERLEYGDGGDPAQTATERAANRARNRLGRLYRHYDEAGLLQHDRYDFKGNLVDKSRRVVSDAALAAGWIADWDAIGAPAALDGTTYQINTEFDALNRPVRITYPEQAADPVGHRAVLTARYNRQGALQRVELDGSPYIGQIAYNAKGQRVLVVHGNGVMTRYVYDPATFNLVRLRSERVQASAPDRWQGRGVPLQELTYTYDLVGNVASIEDRTPGCGVIGSPHGRDRLVRQFVYDALYRLVEANGRACADIAAPRPTADLPRCGAFSPPYRGGPAAPNQGNAPDLTERYTETYEYDPVGNLLASAYQSGGAGWTRRFAFGGRPVAEWDQAPDNRLTRLDQGANTDAYEYDASGNLVRQNHERRYTWDNADRLVGFTIQPPGAAAPSLEARYLYDARGVRVKKWVRTSGSVGDSTVYIEGLFEHVRWKKPGEAAKQHDVLHVVDGARRVALVRQGPAHDGDAGPPVQYHLGDHLDTSAVVVNDAGEWVNREEFFPYGETSFGGFAHKRYRFTGKERDEESGLSYHGARYYAPWLARWTGCDPLGVAPGANLYLYAYCSPVRWADPTGEAPSCAGQEGCSPSLMTTLGAALGYSWEVLTDPQKMEQTSAEHQRISDEDAERNYEAALAEQAEGPGSWEVFSTSVKGAIGKGVRWFSGSRLGTAISGGNESVREAAGDIGASTLYNSFGPISAGSRGYQPAGTTPTKLGREIGEFGYEQVRDALVGKLGSAATAKLLAMLPAALSPTTLGRIHHTATIRGQSWTSGFAELFAKAGMTLEDDVNKVVLPALFHRSKHHDAYHMWVYAELLEVTETATMGLQPGTASYRASYKQALVSRLAEIRAHLTKNPEMVTTGWWNRDD